MKILSFSSMNLDIVYDVKRIVSPGETISSLGREIFCGGKGLNQSIALARAGASVYQAGCVGADGDVLKELLAGNGVDTRFVKTVDGPSGHAIIQVDERGQNSILLYGGANQKITKSFADEVFRFFEEGDMLLLQNEINELPYLMEQAWKKGMSIALNPSPLNDRIWECPLDKVTYFIMNEIEGSRLAGAGSPEDILAGMKRLYPDSRVVLTLGSAGSKYYDGQEVFSQGIYPVKTVDTTAAGDTFLGYFLALVERETPQRVLQTAALAAAMAVSKKGAANSIPTLQEVLTAEKEEL